MRDPAFPKSTLVPEMRWTDPKPTHNMLETHLARGWVLENTRPSKKLEVFTLGHKKVDSLSNQIDLLTKIIDFLV